MEWYGNQNFKFSKDQEELKVLINKNPWESFSLKIDNIELMNNPVLNFQIKTNQDIVLRIDVTDGAFVSCENVILSQNITSSEAFSEVSFDFSEVLSDIDLAGETYLLFYVNPGKKFEGQISILNVELFKGTDPQKPETMVESSSELRIYPSPATDYTFVEIPDGNFSLLKVFDTSGKELISTHVEHFSGSEFKLNLAGITSGYYFVSLVSESNTLTGKVLIR